jgi:TolB-like protein
MKRCASICFVMSVAALALSGCAGTPAYPRRTSDSTREVEKLDAYQRYMIDEPLGIEGSHSKAGRFNSEVIFLADQIERNADRKSLDNTFVVTSVTNLNNLSETTSFGRLLSENLIHELQVRKWKVFEVRLTKDIIVNNTGEFSLSRDIQKIRDVYKIGGIVAGTYSIAEGNIIVNVRVVDINSGIIASSGQIRLPMDWFTESLLGPTEDRQKAMKIVGDLPSRSKAKGNGSELDSSKWIKIEDISR